MVGSSSSNNTFDFRTSIAELISFQASRYPTRPAIAGATQTDLTYASLFDHLTAVNAQFRALSISRADRIAVVLPNGPMMATAFLSIAASATCAPLNPGYRKPEFEFYLSDLNAKALVVEDSSESQAIDAALALGIPILRLAPNNALGAGSFNLRWDAGLIEAVSAADCVWSDADDIGLVLHTSGTTARPKIVPLTQRNLCTSGRNVAQTLELTENDRCLNIMPLFHIHGLIGALMSSLTAGASVYCSSGFSSPHFFEWLREIRPSWYTAVPTMHQAILARADQENLTSNNLDIKLRLVRSSSAALPAQVMAGMEALFGAPVLEAYGMTEAAHQMACNPLPPALRKPGSVGPSAGPEVAIMDADGAFLPDGQTGEIVIRGANVTPGYDNNAEANASAFTNGWFRTGDQGYLDQDKYLFITGRLKELINRGGEKIAPREIDEVLLDHPCVLQAVAFGAPNARLGEEVMAAVVLCPDCKTNEPRNLERSIREFVAGRLADFKVPTRVLFLDEIPKGPTGKMQRVGLAQVLGITTAAEEDRGAAKSQLPDSASAEQIALELSILDLCREILNRKEISVNDNFFLLGGDSLLATRLMGRLEQAENVKLSLVRLFEAPTISGIARAVLDARDQQNVLEEANSNEDLERLLAQMELLSEEEAEQLLLKSDSP